LLLIAVNATRTSQCANTA